MFIVLATDNPLFVAFFGFIVGLSWEIKQLIRKDGVFDYLDIIFTMLPNLILSILLCFIR